MRVLLATALLSILAATAAADPTPDVRKMTSDDCAKARKQNKDCVLTFTGHDVEGGVPGATGLTVVGRPDTRHASLIRIRRDFIQEILKTAEDL